MSDLIRQIARWPLYSRRRLLLVIAGLIVLLVLSGSCHHSKGQAARPAPAPPAIAHVTPHATHTTAPTPATPSVGDALDVATAFVAAWASHQPNPGWLVRVDAYATPGFADALATVDPSRVPATRVTGTAKVTDTGATASTSAAVSTDQGVVSVSLRWDGTAWKVADVRPDAQAVE